MLIIRIINIILSGKNSWVVKFLRKTIFSSIAKYTHPPGTQKAQVILLTLTTRFHTRLNAAIEGGRIRVKIPKIRCKRLIY
jgi:hypothetical protein